MMLEWLRDGRAVFQVPFLSMLAAIWILGPASWITWGIILVIFVVCGIAPTWMAAMTAMTAIDIWASLKWVGNTVTGAIQKVVDIFRR